MSTVAVDVPLDLRATWRKVRFPVVIAVVLVGVAVLLAVFANAPAARPLDPRDASAHGALALSRLVQQQGVRVTAIADAAALQPATDSTVLVVDPGSLSSAELATLAASSATVVVLAPGRRELAALGVDASPSPVTIDDTVQPRCAFPAAADAGDVRFSGASYTDVRDTSCYSDGDAAGLVVQVRPSGSIVVFGSPATFANDHLAQRGDAALSLALLTERPRLLWLLPQQPAQRPADVGSKGLIDLLPDRLLWATLQLVLAVVVIGLWRARRLGPVVPEPLPVVVRAVETVEGRARLLRAARARGRAATSLREATRARLRALLALGGDAVRPVVVDAVVRRTAGAAMDVDRVLYGADPTDDAALVALANELAVLEQTVRES